MPDLTPFTHKFRATGDPGHQNGVNKVQRRNRQPVSCFYCRSKKLKCDRAHPCETCVKRGDGSSCTYGPAVGTQKATASTNDGARRAQAQDRLRSLEILVMQMINTGPDSSKSSVPRSISPGLQGDGKPAAHNDGHLRMEGTESRYTGSTHWSAILDNINELKSVIATENQEMDRFQEQDREEADPDILFGAHSPQSLEQILQQYLPPRQQIDRRLSIYFNARYLIMPVLHSHVFQRQYEDFWNRPLDTPPLWVSLLFSIMCMSATLSQATGSEPSSPENQPNPRDTYLTAAAQCLILGEYTRPRKYVVEALLLFTQCKYMRTLDPSREVNITFAIATRLAFRMGYHRDPDHFGHFTPFEGEMRRRSWTLLKQFEHMHSFQSGIPSNIAYDCYDTKEPRNLLDGDFDETSRELPSSRPATEATPILYMIVKGRLMHIFGKVCRHALAFRYTSAEEMMQLDLEMRTEYENIPEPLRSRPMSKSFTDPSYLIMVRMNCEFLFNKAICVLHRKRMAQGDPISRKACTEAATKLLSVLIDLSEELQPGGQLYSDRWMVSSFTMTDFILASMVLALVVSTHQRTQTGKTVDEAVQVQMHLDMLGKASQICQGWGQTSSEAKRVAEALDAMLRRLRPSTSTTRTQPPETVLTPLSLDDPSKASSSSQVSPSALMTSVSGYPSANEQDGCFDQFDNIFDGSADLDWTAFDTYLTVPDNFWDAGEGWTSAPYSFLGQSQGAARNRYYEMNGVNLLNPGLGNLTNLNSAAFGGNS